MREARCSITWASLFFQHFSTLYHYSFRSLGGPKSQTNSSRFLGGMHSVDIATCPTSQVLGDGKAKPIQAGFLVECIPWTLRSTHKSNRTRCQKVRQTTSLFKAISFRLKGLHVRPIQSQSAKERSVILSNIPFIYLIE